MDSSSARDIASARWIQHRRISGSLWPGALDPGEAEAIDLAREVRADLLLVDDRAGRRSAEQAGVVVAGSLGVLLRAFEAGVITDPNSSPRALRDAGLWIADDLVEQFDRTVDT